MNYKKDAEELMNWLILEEEHGRQFQSRITDLAHGELAVLRFLSEEKNGAHAKEISKRLGVNTSRVAAILNSLVKKGLIDRVADPNDRRMVCIYIKQKGTEYEHIRRTEYIDLISAMLEQLGEKDAENYLRIVKRLAEMQINMK